MPFNKCRQRTIGFREIVAVNLTEQAIIIQAILEHWQKPLSTMGSVVQSAKCIGRLSFCGCSESQTS